jgi:hypothetical protein
MARTGMGAALTALLLAMSAGEALSASGLRAMNGVPHGTSESLIVESGPAPIMLAGHLGQYAAEIERILQGIWSNVRGAAQSGDIDRLLTYFAVDQQDKYRHVFADLGRDGLAQSIGSIEMIHLMSVSDYWAEVEAIRTENSEKFSYPMSFIKERGEVWKLEGL